MRRLIILLVPVMLLLSCGGKKNNPAPPPPPAKTLLTTPVQNGICVTGTVISDTQSSVTFAWNASENTDNYDVFIKNLLTSVTTTQNTTQTQLTATLSRSTPYSWYVVSKSAKISSTAQSDTWKFYNSGPGVVTYAPFPADITAPTSGQIVTTSTVNLTWTGSAVDNSTIASYDVYFGTASNPPLLQSGVTDSFINNITLTAKTTYYWKVMTKDKNNDTSDSGIYQFSTNW